MLPHLSFVLDVVGACLLLIMILYAVQLSRRLNNLQADKAHLQRLIASFDASTGRADQSVVRLRAGVAEASEILQANMAKATELRDDLAFLIDRASAVADRAEAAGETSPRAPGRASNGNGAAAHGLSGAGNAQPETYESNLMRALEGVR